MALTSKPWSRSRLKQVFQNSEDGWEDVVDNWEECAAAVLDLIWRMEGLEK